MRLHTCRLAVVVLVCPFLPHWSNTVSSIRAQSSKAPISEETRARVRQAVAATVLVLVRSQGDTGPLRPRGSAVLVRGTGIAATNLHVITDSRTNRPYDEIVLSISSEKNQTESVTRYRSGAVLINREFDLALIQVQGDASGNPIPKSFTFPAVEIADSRQVKLLDDLFVIGFPEKGGTTVTVNSGVVEGKDELLNWIKTDARLLHGNSGGAAVNSQGKLVGIPTKVVADQQPIDRNGDGFPDDYRRFGAVGFLRPSHLVELMLDQLDKVSVPLAQAPPKEMTQSVSIIVRGILRSADTHKPIAGGLVGLVSKGEVVSGATLLTWGGTNSEGEFRLNKPVPPGHYTLRARATGYKPQTVEIEISPTTTSIVVEM
jgi:S1-C subfamily serine protease